MNRALLKMVRNTPSQLLRSFAGRAMATALVAFFAACVAATATQASPLPQNDEVQAPTVRERVMAMPPHTLVQVRVHNTNLRGRVSVTTRKGFVIQFISDGKNRKQKLSYDDVQSIQAVDGNGRGASFSIHFAVDDGSGQGVDVEIDH
jgi:hypothetical protein